jgi:hypothetical protein
MNVTTRLGVRLARACLARRVNNKHFSQTPTPAHLPVQSHCHRWNWNAYVQSHVAGVDNGNLVGIGELSEVPSPSGRTIEVQDGHSTLPHSAEDQSTGLATSIL